MTLTEYNELTEKEKQEHWRSFTGKVKPENYYIKFNSAQERTDLFNFFIENGFQIYREFDFMPQSLEQLDDKYPYESLPYGIIYTKMGSLQVRKSLERIKREKPELEEIPHDSPPQVFYDLVLEYKKKNNLPLEVILKGNRVYDEVPF